MKKRLIVERIVVVLVIIILICVGLFKYDFKLNCYKATNDATAYLDKKDVQIDIEDDYIAFGDDNAATGIIFYPGARVETKAYVPLMYKLASKGYKCIALNVKDNFAILSVNAANGVEETYSEVKNWYLMGHSIGGVGASMYLKNNPDKFKGIIYLASYSFTDLTDLDIKVLSIYGSNDAILNFDDYNEAKDKLPNINEVEIDGGNHAYFGMYGIQSSKDASMISNESQLDETVDIIVDFINSNG